MTTGMRRYRLLPCAGYFSACYTPRHERDWLEFKLIRFNEDDFMEAFPYDYMEIEYINLNKPRAMSDDHRNAV